MTNGYVDKLLIIMQGFLAEALALDKTLASGLERDFVRLKSLSSEHGISLFTILLPSLSKGLDLSLDSGFLCIDNLPCSRPVSNTTLYPRLFQGIWSKLFTRSGVLRSAADLDPTFVLILKSILGFGKKLDLKCSDSVVYSTVREFFDVDARLPSPGQFWSDEESDLGDRSLGSLCDLDCGAGDLFGTGGYIPPGSKPPLQICQLIADRIVSTRFGSSLEPDKWSFKHGPGATAEIPRGKGYKYSFPTWNPRLESVLPYDSYGVSSMENAYVTDNVSPFPDEADFPSRLCLVPKDMRGPRLIAAEPACNQWAQQGLAGHLVDCIAKFPQDIGGSITFRKQSNSQYLTLSASRTARLATVDLSAASDRLSCWLVQRVFRSNRPLLRYLASTRTMFMSNTVDKKLPTHLKLRKFATMGSALTFPLQSIVFFCLAVSAVCYTRKIHPRNWQDACKVVQVYGDDIIIPVDSLECLQQILAAVGLKVNSSKTFSGRNFRESCGVEAFRGYDVTPSRPRHLFDSDGSVSVISCIDVSNLLHGRGLWYAARAIRTLADTRGAIPVVRTGNGVWGDKSFVDPWDRDGNYRRSAKRRWSTDLHRYEYLFLQPKAVKNVTRRFEGHENLLQYFTEDPAGQELPTWTSGETFVADAAIVRRWVPRSFLASDRSE